jgi:hypothetical protein
MERKIDQHSLAQTQIADEYTWHLQRLHDRPNDDRAGGYDFLSAFL